MQECKILNDKALGNSSLHPNSDCNSNERCHCEFDLLFKIVKSEDKCCDIVESSLNIWENNFL